MAVKWIWGFESGASREFYSGSGWGVDSPHPDGSASLYTAAGLTEASDGLYDFSHNHPHQPPTTAGGGRYSLRVGAPFHSSIGGDGDPGSIDMSELPFGILSPSFGNLTEGCLSLSVHSDSDFADWPDDAPGSGIAAVSRLQRFLALYPEQTNLVPTSGSDLSSAFKVRFLDSPISQSPSLPAQLQLYSFSTGTLGGPVENKIAAVCRYGFANTGSVPDATTTGTGPVLGISDSCNFLWPYMPQYFSVIAATPWEGGTNWGLVAYTSSAGVSLQQGWNEVTINYIPHASSGTIKIFLNGTAIIDQEGVPTGYSSSVDDGGTPIDTGLGWGKILFTTTPFTMLPRALAPELTGTLEPSGFLYDHVVVFDENSDLDIATSSIYVQGVGPVLDHETGNFIGDNSQTASLFDFVDDQNYFMNNNYLMASSSAPSGNSCDFYYNKLNFLKAGSTEWDMNNVLSIVGVNVISAVSGADVSGSSVYRGCNPVCSPFATGTAFNLAGKQFVHHTSGSDSDGRSWDYLTGSGAEGITAGLVYIT